MLSRPSIKFDEKAQNQMDSQVPDQWNDLQDIRVLLKGRHPGWQMHSIYKTMIENPPERIRFLLEKPGVISLPDFRPLIRAFRSKSKLGALFGYPLPLLSMLSSRVEASQDWSVVFGAQTIIRSSSPWVADAEFVTALTAYGSLSLSRRVIETALMSKQCKAILPWSSFGEKSFLSNLDCHNFNEKIKVIRLAVPSKNVKRKTERKKIRLLFVGTSNASNTPFSFEYKGGREIIEAFSVIESKYDNAELVIRSDLPSDCLLRCKNLKNVKTLRGYLSKDEMGNLYATSDILVNPTFEMTNTSMIEAMSYGIPVVTTDLYDHGELVRPYETGLLVTPPANLPYFSGPNIPNNYTSEFTRYLVKPHAIVVKELIATLSQLIEESRLLNRLSVGAKHLVEKGLYSLQRRNMMLREALEGAMSR